MARQKITIPTEGIVDVTIEQKIALYRQAVYDGAKITTTIDLDEWMDEHFRLPRETASEWGQWRTDRFPPIRRIAKCLSPSSIAQDIPAMKGHQLFFTTLGIGWKHYTTEVDPGPMIYLQKTEDDVRDYSIQKYKPHIKACDRIRKIIGDEKPKGYANSWDMKAYPGGFVALMGANVASKLRSKSTGKAIADEEDTYELTVSKEGSPIELIRKRMSNFPNRKLFRPSTPVRKETSTIEPAWEAGSQERYYVPCPHCNPNADDDGFMFWIEWEHIRWSDDCDPMTDLPIWVWLECPGCASEIDEGEHKTWMLEKGDWFSEKLGPRQRVGDVLNPSFHISSLYSPLGFYSWRDAVKEWFAYQKTKDVEKLQVFINQTLAQTFTVTGDISYSYLESRRENYTGNMGNWDVPNGVYCLTAGVDIQDDRIELEVVGWGSMDESWSIDYAVLPGDTALMGDRSGMLQDGQPSVWRLLHDYLVTKRFVHECGVEMPIEVTMVDSGHMTDQVHTFCRHREGNRIFPLKGQDGRGKGHFDRSKKRHEKYGTVLYWANTFHLKNTLYHWLKLTDPGPGFCHFPLNDKYNKRYFQGLTCERLVPKMQNGRQVLKWETPSGARNEPIDCRCYAIVAREVYGVDIDSRARNGLHSVFPKAGTAGGIVTPRKKTKRKAKPNSWI